MGQPTPGARIIEAIADAPIAMPNEAALLTAEYVRDGADLRIETADGGVTVVSGYFDLSQPADLVIGGAVVPGRVVGKLARERAETDEASTDDGAAGGGGDVAALTDGDAADAAAEAQPLGEPIAEITQFVGGVSVLRADGTTVAAEPGVALYEDDVLVTNGDSSVGVTFIDGMTFSLGADARMVLDEFAWAPDDHSGGGLLSILQGEFSFVSGGAAHTAEDALMIETPTMTIGVRGTKVVSKIAAEGETSRIALLAEEDGTVGKIIVITDGGEELISEPNKMVEVTSRFESPSAQMELSTAQVVEFFGDALNELPAPQEFFNRDDEGADAAPRQRSNSRADEAEQGGDAVEQPRPEAPISTTVEPRKAEASDGREADGVDSLDIEPDAASLIAEYEAQQEEDEDDAEDEAEVEALRDLASSVARTGGPGRVSRTDGEAQATQAAETQAPAAPAGNSAPVLDNSGWPTLTSILEGDQNSAGDTVASLLSNVSITDANGAAVQAIAVTAATSAANGKMEYSIDGGATFQAVGAVSDSSALLLGPDAILRFMPDNVHWHGTATIEFRAWDMTSGASGDTGVDTTSNGGSTAFSVVEESASLVVEAVNDAPKLTITGTPALDDVTEDSTSHTGDSVADIVVDGSILDHDHVGSEPEAIAVTSVDESNGTWQYSLDGGSTFTNVGAVSDNSALLLDATARLRFVPDADYVGSASFTYRAWDMTTGSCGDTGVDVSVNDGATAYSGDVETASVTVVAGASDGPVLSEATSFDFSAGDLAIEAGDPGAASNDLDPNSGSMTIEAWFYYDGSASSDETIVSKGHDEENKDGYAIRMDGADLVVSLNANDGSADYKSAASSIDLGSTPGWYHVAMVIDNTFGQVRGYLNGSSAGWSAGHDGIANDLFTPTDIDVSNGFVIGASETDDGALDKFGNLSVSDVRVWDVARSEADIAADMARELTGAEANLVVNFRLDESSGTSVTDVVSGATATVTGGVNWVLDSIFGNESSEEPLHGRLEARDTDGDPLSFTVSASAVNGTATIDSATGAWEYTPVAGYTGSDTFSYQVSDGDGGIDTVNISVTVS